MNPTNWRRYGAGLVALVSVIWIGACAEIEPKNPADNESTNQQQSNEDDNDNGDSTGDCGGDDECPGAEVCVYPEDPASGDRECRLPVEEPVGDGEPCESSEECESKRCVDGICSAECETGADCPDQWDCTDDNYCRPPVCDSEQDCGTDQACAIRPGDEGLITICRIDGGEAETGDECADHGDCRARYCLDGTCTAPCVDGPICGPGQKCEETSISRDDRQEVLSVCSPTEVEICESPQDCDGEDTTCNTPTYGADGQIDGASCGPSNDGGADVGAACTEHADCASDLCRRSENADSGECSVFCGDSDRDCANNQSCMDVGDQFGICALNCTRNETCADGDVCTLGADRGSGEFIRICQQPFGDLGTGEECETDADCATNVCLTSVAESQTECSGDEQCPADAQCGCPPTDPDCNQHICYTAENFCSEMCDPANDDADCTDGDHDLTRCAENITVTTEDGNEEMIPMCAPPQ